MTSRTVTVRIVMDEDGKYEVASDEAEAVDRWETAFGDRVGLGAVLSETSIRCCDQAAAA